MATKRPKTAPGFWSVRPQNPHLLNEGLQKVKTEMLNKLTRMRNANSDNWSSDSNDDQQMPPIRLSTEHGKFLDGLPDYLSYGGGRSSTYYCPCSRTMKDWRKGINMGNWEQYETSQFKGTCKGLDPLLDHCRDMGDVYHLGFAEYTWTVTEEAQRPQPRTGHYTASVTEEAIAHPEQPCPYATRASDTRARHK